MHEARRLAGAALALALASGLAGGAGPREERAACWPSLPGEDPLVCQPNDPRYPGRWEFRSDIPAEIDRDRMHPSEVALGSIGFSLDTAWQYGLGRDDVIIAVLDSGIRWRHRDLTNKLYLNAGELPLPAGATIHDANGDGVFDVRDYAGDPRVGDTNGNGFVDPGDLILAFSDCVDDDRNGYVDDISGYDFFSGSHCGVAGSDNDPEDQTDFGHGTGIASTAAAEANNAIEDTGVCPRCRVLPVRVGDSFVVDANQFARGVVFATRAGASVIAAALGSYNNTPAARRAVDFAYEHEVALIASAADEFSYHHNYPSVYNHALYVNAIRHNDARDWRRASTFWGVNPCTNFGARVWITVPAISCSSGATSRLAGVAGLVQSAARDTDTGRLSAEELYQVLRETADDLDNTDPDWGAARWAARPGFDQYSGYGRLNAREAVLAAKEGRIPPEVDLGTPDWFAIVSPRLEPRLSVTGRIRALRSEQVAFRLEYALGVEPSEDEYRLVAEGPVVGVREGVLGVLDFSKLPLPSGPAPTDREGRDRYSVTLRLSARDASGHVGEARRSFFVLDDPTWKRPFPIQLGASGEAAPLLVDLDGDGRDEIVIPTADGLLRILSWHGPIVNAILAPLDAGPPLDPLSHEPQFGRETVVRSAVVGDITGRGTKAIVVASREGGVYAFSASGERLPGFPVRLPPELAAGVTKDRTLESGILSRPVLADLDGKPGAEIIVTALDGHVHVWRGDGKPLAGFPVALEPPGAPGQLDKIVSTPAVGDLDGDGRPEIVSGFNGGRSGPGRVWAVRAAGRTHPDGPFLPGWPIELLSLRPALLPTVASGVAMEPLLADVDGDGDQEVALYAVAGSAIVLIDHKESGPREIARFALSPGPDSPLGNLSFIAGTGSGMIADTDHDGVKELYAPLLPLRMLTLRSYPGVPLDVPLALGGWPLKPAAGEPVPMLDGYPRRMEDLMLFAQPTAADVDGDGRDEVLMGSGGYLLHAFAKDGGEAAGFPKFTGGWIFSGSAVGDIDGDGRPELAAVTREGWLFVWQVGPAEVAAADVKAAREP